MTDLTTLPPNSTPSRPTTSGPGAALSALLDTAASPEDAARAILADPALLAECRAVLPTLERIATAKAGEDGVRRVIGKRFELYPQPQRTDEQWAAWWADYFDALADKPLAALEAGMRAYVADPESEFMPKPGKLRELAFTAPSRSLERFYRAKRAVQLADEAARPALAGPRVDPLAVRTMLAEYEAQFARRQAEAKPVRPPLPSISGKTDETGITPEMRALMERRAEGEG